MDVTPSSVSLFTGGIIPRLLRRLGVRDTAFDRVRTASAVIVPFIAWFPPFALSAIGGTLLDRGLGTPFLLDLGAHIRLLVVLPLLLVAGRVAEVRIGPTIQQFVLRFIVPDEMVRKFDAAIASAFRLGDSILADILTIVAIVAGSLLIRHAYVGLNTSTWFATLSSQGTTLTPAGMWYTYVSLPIVQFVLLRWYYRLFIWARFLLQVAKLRLRLIPTHPDQVGGLGFLLSATVALSVFAMAHGALLAASLANRVLLHGASLKEFTQEIAIVVVFILCITIAPLFAFTRPLVLAKRRGILQYGELASHYIYDFDKKWIHSENPHNEELIGSADVQSLADMATSYELVRNMRVLPLTGGMILAFVIAVLAPVAPLLLTLMPLNELLQKLVNILF